MNSTANKQLKSQAHVLKPIIMIGQSGLTAAVIAEIELALECHELIKIKIRSDRETRKQIGEQICSDTGSELIQSIGQVIVIYRKNPEK